MGWFITGTDTGVGKTFTTALLIAALRRAGKNAVAMKPLCCGERDDARILWEASGRNPQLSLDAINPVWLRPPLAPYTASMIEERAIDTARIVEACRTLQTRFDTVLVEGVGGWRVPIRRDYDAADLAADLGFPVLLVVQNRLGAINHTLLTLESIRNRGCTCPGIILNEGGPAHGEPSEFAKSTNPAIIEELSGLPILATIAQGQTTLDLNPNLQILAD